MTEIRLTRSALDSLMRFAFRSGFHACPANFWDAPMKDRNWETHYKDSEVEAEVASVQQLSNPFPDSGLAPSLVQCGSPENDYCSVLEGAH